MNVIDYAKKYGSLTLEKEPLNEADKLLFSLLSYVPYSGTVSSTSKNKKTIHDVAKEFFSVRTKKENKRNLMAIRSGIKILSLIKDMPRYKDLLLYNDCYIADEAQQFSAVCIEINPKLVFVSFEGTDHMVSGWQEDFEMSYSFPVPAQVHAVKYLNRKFFFKRCKIIIGGHSKGGNLALVSSMYSNFWIRRKIQEIYSFDGPGLRKKQFESRRYRKIKDKYTLVVPHNSLIGITLYHPENLIAIKSTGVGFLGHFAENWQLDDMNYKRVKLGKASQYVDEELKKWQEKYTDEEMKTFVEELFDLFKKNEVVDVIQMLEKPKLILKLLKESQKLDETAHQMIKEVVEILMGYSKKTILSIIKR